MKAQAACLRMMVVGYRTSGSVAIPASGDAVLLIFQMRKLGSDFEPRVRAPNQFTPSELFRRSPDKTTEAQDWYTADW
jgi:hypothetical protein